MRPSEASIPAASFIPLPSNQRRVNTDQEPEQRVTKRPPRESDGLDVTMEPATGLEPATGSLQNCYATIASCRHTKVRVEPLYDNNPDSQSSSHKRYNHQHQDRAEHVTHPNTAEGIRDAPIGSYAFRLSHRPAFIIVNAKQMHRCSCFTHRNRTVNRSCRTAAGIWLYWFAARIRHPSNAIPLLECYD